MRDELIETLGRERLAALEKRARGRRFHGRCETCGRLFITYEFASLVVSEPFVMTGTSVNGAERCRKCLSLRPQEPPSTGRLMRH